MRAPPFKKKSWMAGTGPLALLFAALILIGAAIFFAAPRRQAAVSPATHRVDPQQPNPEMVSVVVPIEDMHTAESFEPARLSTILMPASLVPPSTITSVAELSGKVAMGPIGARSFISRVALGNPVAIPDGPLRPTDSVVEDLLSALATRLVKVTVAVKGPPLVRGSRVSLYSSAAKSALPAIEECWVLAAEPKATTLLVYPEDASVLQAMPQATLWHAEPKRGYISPAKPN